MRLLLIVIFGCIFFPAQAQVSFSILPFDQALKKAGEEGKMLMVILDAPSCSRCNEITTMSLLDPAAKELNDSCVVIRPAINSADFANLQKRFAKDSTGTGGVIFFNSQGDVLAANFMVSQSAEGYVLLLNRPLKVNRLIGQMRKHEAVRMADSNNIQALEQILDLRYRLAWNADSLANIYFNKLPKDSLSSDRVLSLLFRSAPILRSRMDSTVRTAIYANGNKVYKSIARPELQSIYRNMIIKSRNKAIREKDLKYQALVSEFAKSIAGGSPRGDIYFYREMLEYCSAVKDSLNYFRLAEVLANNFLLKMPADSVLKIDADIQSGLKKSDSVVSKQSYYFGPMIDGEVLIGTSRLSDRTAYELNTISWNVYKIYKSQATLKTALQWSKKSLDYHVLPAYYDTYARLLYVTGEPEKAIEVMQMAVQLGIRQLADVTIFQMAIEAMKKGMALPDPM